MIFPLYRQQIRLPDQAHYILNVADFAELDLDITSTVVADLGHVPANPARVIQLTGRDVQPDLDVAFQRSNFGKILTVFETNVSFEGFFDDLIGFAKLENPLTQLGVNILDRLWLTVQVPVQVVFEFFGFFCLSAGSLDQAFRWFLLLAAGVKIGSRNRIPSAYSR